MFRNRMSPLLALALIFATLVSILGTTRDAAAETRGSVVIHSRACETDAVNLFNDCHNLGGPSGSVYTVDSRVPKAIDGSGNVSFGSVIEGDHLITLTSGYDSGAYSSIRAFCSNVTLGSGPNEATILWSETPQFWARVGSESQLVCDVYFIP